MVVNVLISFSTCVHIHGRVNVHTHASIYNIHIYRNALIPGAGSPRQLNFVGPKYTACFMPPLWRRNFEMDPRFLKKSLHLCTYKR